MKRRILSFLICGGLLLGQTVVTEITVNALEVNKLTSIQSNIGDNLKKLNADIVVDSQYTGIEGARVKGSVTYSTVQNALDSISINNKKEVKILIMNGVYYEKLTINKPNITLIGEDAYNTILSYDAANGVVIPVEAGGDGVKTYGTTGSASITVTSEATGFTAANITIENSFDEVLNANIKNRQAVAMKNSADESLFVNCRFIGNQDTLYPAANKQYYYNCYIEGDVDFIFGGATAVFDECEIHSVDRSLNPKGYVTAPSTLAEKEFGFVIKNSKLTSDIEEAGTVYLGRPWHPSSEKNPIDSNVVYLNCEMGAHISSIGWSTMNNDSPMDNTMYEYGSYGAGALESDTRRVLSDEESLKYTTENVLADWDFQKDLKKVQLNLRLLTEKIF